MIAAMKRLLVAIVATTALVLAPAAQALAPPCPTQPEARTLVEGLSGLESIAINPQGHLYFTENPAGRLLSLRKPGAKPKVVADGIEGPGGIVFQRRHILVGFGDNVAQGSDGAANPEAGLLRVDPKTGESTVFTEGLQMANGVARSAGVIYASTDFGTGIDRITNRGADVELGWAQLVSPNGLVVDSTGKFIFATQTFTASAIQKIPIKDPAAMSTYYAAPVADSVGGYDGLARDAQDRLYVAANGSGQILRIDGPGAAACSLADLPPFPDGPSALFFGRGDGQFDHDSLFVVTFSGKLIELRNAR
jgi:hypothetical protein